MDFYASYWSDIVSVVKVITIVVASYNCTWSYRSFVSLIKSNIRDAGHAFAVRVVNSGIFLVSLGTAILQLMILLRVDYEAVSAFSLACFILILMGQIFFSLGHKTQIGEKIKRNSILYDNSEYLVSLAELSKLDPMRAMKIKEIADGELIEVIMAGERSKR